MNALLQQLFLRAEKTPGECLLSDDQQELTATALVRQVTLAAEALSVEQASTIGLYADNSVDWIIADLACQAAGLTLVPIPTFFSTSQCQHIVDSAAISRVIFADSQPRSFQQVFALKPTMPATRLAGTRGLSLYPLRPKKTAAIPTGTGKVTFTSGSTGTPKGVCLSTVQCLNVARALSDAINIKKPKHLCLLPLSTLLENIGGVYQPLLAGGSVVAPSPAALGLQGSSALQQPSLLAAIEYHQPNTLILIPQMLTILDHALSQGWQPPASLAFVAVGGARVSASVLARVKARGLPVYEGYGLSECGSVVALNLPQTERQGSCGQLLEHVTASIEHGEIMIGGNPFLGYLNQKDSWGKSRIATGDLGALDSDGFLSINGRRKNQLISSFGRNISPEWLESELLAQPALQQAVVFGDGQAYCIALIYPRDKAASDHDIQQLIEQLNQHLPDYARIQNWWRLPQALSADDGLLTANGRPRREHIAQHYAENINHLYTSTPENLAL